LPKGERKTQPRKVGSPDKFTAEVTELKESELYKHWSTSIAIFGRTGSGKSTALKWLVEVFYLSGRKVIELDTTKNFESGFYKFKGNAEWQTERRYRFLYDFDMPPNMVQSARSFPVQLLVPAVNTLDEYVPSCFEFFKIPFNKISLSNWYVLLGESASTSSQKYLFAKIFKALPQGSEFIDLLNECVDYLAGQSTLKVKNRELKSKVGGLVNIIHRLTQLYESGVIGNNNDKKNLDIKKIMRDNHRITCIYLRAIEDVELRNVVTTILIDIIIEARTYKKTTFDESGRPLKREQYPPLVIGIREVHEMAPNVTETLQDKPGVSGLRSKVVDLMKTGRSIEIRMIVDSQIPSRIHPDILSQSYTVMSFKADRNDLKTIKERKSFPEDFYSYVTKFTRGDFMFVAEGPQCGSMAPPPASACSREQEQFIDRWIETGGAFVKNTLEQKTFDMGIQITKKKEKLETESPDLAKDDLTRAIIGYVKEHPGVRRKEIYRVLPKSDDYKGKIIRRLRDEGTIIEKKHKLFLAD